MTNFLSFLKELDINNKTFNTSYIEYIEWCKKTPGEYNCKNIYILKKFLNSVII